MVPEIFNFYQVQNIIIVVARCKAIFKVYKCLMDYLLIYQFSNV